MDGNGLFDAPSCSLRRLFLSYSGRRRRSNFPLGVKVAFDPRGPAMRKEGIKGGKIDTSVSRFSQRFPFLHSLRRRHFVAARYRTNLRSAPPHIPSFFVVAPFGIGLFLKYPFPVSNWKTKKLGIRHIPAEKSAQQSLLIPTSLKLLPPGVPMNN